MSGEVIDQSPEEMAEVTQGVLKRERYWDEKTKTYTDGNGDEVEGI